MPHVREDRIHRNKGVLLKIELDNCYATLVEATEDELDWVESYLTFEFVSFGYKGARKIRYLKLYNRRKAMLPAGLVELISRTAPKEEGFSVEVVDVRKAPVPAGEIDVSRADWLYDHQTKGVQSVVDKTRGIVWVPTGGGKTEIAVGLSVAIPCKWLFLVHRGPLLHQAAKRYELRTGEPAGVLGDGSYEFDSNFTVATFQTLWARKNTPEVKKLLESVQGIMVDEAHVLPATSFWQAAMNTPNAYYRVGLSGTPLVRGDKRSTYTVGALGPTIYRITPQVLIDLGILAKPKIQMVPVEQVYHAQRRVYNNVYKALIVNSRPRNEAVVEIAHAAAKPALIFVQRVKHGKILLSMLRASGLRVDLVEGKHASGSRQTYIEALERGDLDALICTVIFQEGVDIPDLQSVIVASGGASSIAAIQRMGRGMRSGSGKNTFEVWDIMDAGDKWLHNHSKGRARAYLDEGHEVTIGPVGGEVAPYAPRRRKRKKRPA